MVEAQIRARGIKNSNVLDALRKIPRHEFVPLDLSNKAYDDMPLAIGENQTISQPYIVAWMTELLELSCESKVLEIGTGSGYQTAVLAEIAKEVYTIEISSLLAERAKQILVSLNYKNISFKEGDGYLGWPESAPFDGILLTAAPERVPEPLFAQLKEGRNMVIPIGSHPNQTLYVIRKVHGKIQQEKIVPVSFVPMIGMIRKEENQGG